MILRVQTSSWCEILDTLKGMTSHIVPAVWLGHGRALWFLLDIGYILQSEQCTQSELQLG